MKLRILAIGDSSEEKTAALALKALNL